MLQCFAVINILFYLSALSRVLLEHYYAQLILNESFAHTCSLLMNVD